MQETGSEKLHGQEDDRLVREERYRLLFAEANDPIFVYDLDGWFLDANRRALELFGYTREELLKMQARQLFPDDDRRPAECPLSKIRAERRLIYESVGRQATGHLIVIQVSASLTSCLEQPIVQAIVRDITQQKRAEAEILRWNQELTRLSQTTTALMRINHLISSAFDINQIWQAFTWELQQLMPADRVGLTLLKGEGRNIMVKVMTLTGKWAGRTPDYQPLKDGSSIGWIIRHQVPHIVRDLSLKQEFSEDRWLLEEGIRSVIRIPIFIKGNLIGIMFVDSSTPQAYSEHHLAILEPIAVQLAITLEKERLYRRLEEKERQARLLYELTADLNLSLDLDSVLSVLTRKTAEAMGVLACLVGLVAGEELVARQFYNIPPEIISELRFKKGEGWLGKVWATGRPVVVPDLLATAKYPHLAEAVGAKALAAAPILFQGQVIGVICAYSQDAGDFSREAVTMLGAFAAQAAVAINNAQSFKEIREAKEKIEEMSQRDFLTGLYNRQFFESLFLREKERAARYRHVITVAMLDIDNFKTINDIYGHQMGDEVLRLLGHLVLDTVRQIDIPGRFGGDEMVIAFPETTQGEAMAAINRLKLALSHLNESKRFPFPVEISIGLASGRRNYDFLLQEADMVMYQEKQRKKGLEPAKIEVVKPESERDFA
jgi:diguanylate cyclase (GGDEF)-like protein/PAS domain S-box-containing protein